jgi:hypothetical protein
MRELARDKSRIFADQEICGTPNIAMGKETKLLQQRSHEITSRIHAFKKIIGLDLIIYYFLLKIRIGF